MTRFYNATQEAVEQWDKLAERGHLEVVPSEIPDVGGFEFFVIDRGVLADSHALGGYDMYNDEIDETESLVIVGEEVPSHVRGLLVAHIVLHKTLPDNGSPHLCNDHDKHIQAVVAEAEPSLVEPFYREAETMYRQGFMAHSKYPDVPQLILDRYNKGLLNSSRRGQMAEDATDTRQRLEDQGLVLPSDELELVGVNKINGQKTTISLQEERGKRHKCKSCNHPIPKGSQRITTSTQHKVEGFDHHHFHPGCFTHLELGIFSGLQLIDTANELRQSQL